MSRSVLSKPAVWHEITLMM